MYKKNKTKKQQPTIETTTYDLPVSSLAELLAAARPPRRLVPPEDALEEMRRQTQRRHGRIVAGIPLDEGIPPDHILVSAPSAREIARLEATGRLGDHRRLVVLDCLEYLDHTHTKMVFDTESAKKLVNALSEVIAAVEADVTAKA